MKKRIIIWLFFQCFYVFSQEIYIPGCIYQGTRPVPAYWVNDNIEILGKPVNAVGEATSVLSYSF